MTCTRYQYTICTKPSSTTSPSTTASNLTQPLTPHISAHTSISLNPSPALGRSPTKEKGYETLSQHTQDSKHKLSEYRRTQRPHWGINRLCTPQHYPGNRNMAGPKHDHILRTLSLQCWATRREPTWWRSLCRSHRRHHHVTRVWSGSQWLQTPLV